MTSFSLRILFKSFFTASLASEKPNNCIAALLINWKFLPDSVRPYFSIKVVVLGTESTGKSTLTERLAKYFNCSSVKEAGRDLIVDSNL